MATFKISGVWKNEKNVITHYAFHKVNSDSTAKAIKTTKAEAIRLLEIPGNTAITLIWNYTNSEWKNGRTVEVVKMGTTKYLRSNPDNTLTDNLAHLIDYDWLDH